MAELTPEQHASVSLEAYNPETTDENARVVVDFETGASVLVTDALVAEDGPVVEATDVAKGEVKNVPNKPKDA